MMPIDGVAPIAPKEYCFMDYHGVLQASYPPSLKVIGASVHTHTRSVALIEMKLGKELHLLAG